MNNRRSNDFRQMNHTDAFDTSLEKPADGFPLPLTNEVFIRKRKRTHNKLKKRLKIAAIVVGIIALIAGGAAWAVVSSIKAGESAMKQASEPTQIETVEDAVSYDEGRTIEHDGHTYAYNENIVSVVVMGYDKSLHANSTAGSGQADAVMVLALDTKTGKATVIGIPRDSMVDVGEFVGDAFIGQEEMQLCLAFSYGDGAHTSCEYTTTAVSRALYNMPMSYYMALDYDGIAPLNDAIGGVSVNALETIPNTGIVAGQDIVLYGDNAARYVQYRDTSTLTSSLDRQARQVQYLQAFSSKALAIAKGNVTSLIDLFNVANQYSVTNLGVNEFGYLASSVLTNGITSLEMVTLPGEPVQGAQFVEVYLDEEAVYQTVLDVYYTQVD